MTDTLGQRYGLAGKVAAITGGADGIGRASAQLLADLGASVAILDRDADKAAALATELSATGATAIALAGDVGDEAQLEAAFAQLGQRFGRLDVLVNNAAYMHHQLIEKMPFWEKELDAQKILDVGLRSAYVASWHAARIMVPQHSGIIAMTSSFGATCYMHGPAYGAQKAGLDKLAHDMEHDLRGTGVIAVSLWLGPQVTERALIAAKTHPEQYTEFLASAENPEFSGHVIDAIDHAANRDELSGQTLIVAEIARELGIKDRGQDRPSHRDMLGSPRPKNPAAVY